MSNSTLSVSTSAPDSDMKGSSIEKPFNTEKSSGQASNRNGESETLDSNSGVSLKSLSDHLKIIESSVESCAKNMITDPNSVWNQSTIVDTETSLKRLDNGEPYVSFFEKSAGYPEVNLSQLLSGFHLDNISVFKPVQKLESALADDQNKINSQKKNENQNINLLDLDLSAQSHDFPMMKTEDPEKKILAEINLNLMKHIEVLEKNVRSQFSYFFTQFS